MENEKIANEVYEINCVDHDGAYISEMWLQLEKRIYPVAFAEQSLKNY